MSATSTIAHRGTRPTVLCLLPSCVLFLGEKNAGVVTGVGGATGVVGVARVVAVIGVAGDEGADSSEADSSEYAS